MFVSFPTCMSLYLLISSLSIVLTQFLKTKDDFIVQLVETNLEAQLGYEHYVPLSKLDFSCFEDRFVLFLYLLCLHRVADRKS